MEQAAVHLRYITVIFFKELINVFISATSYLTWYLKMGHFIKIAGFIKIANFWSGQILKFEIF